MHLSYLIKLRHTLSTRLVSLSNSTYLVTSSFMFNYCDYPQCACYENRTLLYLVQQFNFPAFPQGMHSVASVLPTCTLQHSILGVLSEVRNYHLQKECTDLRSNQNTLYFRSISTEARSNKPRQYTFLNCRAT